MTKPQSLRGFIRQGGGVWEKPGGMTGELRHLRECFSGLVNSKTGRPLDRMREAAAEAGYLGADTARAISESTIQDLLDAIHSDSPVYSVYDEHEIYRLLARREEWEWKRAVRDYSYADETGLVEAAKDLEAFEYLGDGGMNIDQAAASPTFGLSKQFATAFRQFPMIFSAWRSVRLPPQSYVPLYRRSHAMGTLLFEDRQGCAKIRTVVQQDFGYALSLAIRERHEKIEDDDLNRCAARLGP